MLSSNPANISGSNLDGDASAHKGISSSFVKLALVTMLLVHTALLAWSAYRHSPVLPEVGHLSAGISHWQFGRFDLYRVNPPLVRMLAAIPVILLKPVTNWSNYSVDPLVRAENTVGLDFINANGPSAFWLYTVARWACIPLSLVGAWVCYAWARDLFGISSALVSCALWCFCPNILGHAPLVVPDVPAAALGVAACYTFWCWFRRPTWLNAIATGAVLGVAELMKTTLIIFYPLWPLLWLAGRALRQQRMSVANCLREGTMVLLQVVISVYVINVVYGFEGSFQRAGEYTFRSGALTGVGSTRPAGTPGNRLASTWLADLRVPLPRNYVQGIDTQKIDFERGMRSYLRGQWSDDGWWYYYLYGMLVKVPLGTWILFAFASTSVLWRGQPSLCTSDLLPLVLPPIVILILVSSQTGFSTHFRYALPIAPFGFIWAGQSTRTVAANKMARVAVPAALMWSIASSILCYPHSLSYFNEIVGGPRHGGNHLLDSGIAWGQDLLYLRDWCVSHPEAQPFHLAAFGLVDPRLAGIEFTLPPSGPQASDTGHPTSGAGFRASPGWYAIDVNYLHGGDRPAANGKGGFSPVAQNNEDLQYFKDMVPVASAGYSIYIYHIENE